MGGNVAPLVVAECSAVLGYFVGADDGESTDVGGSSPPTRSAMLQVWSGEDGCAGGWIGETRCQSGDGGGSGDDDDDDGRRNERDRTDSVRRSL